MGSFADNTQDKITFSTYSCYHRPLIMKYLRLVALVAVLASAYCKTVTNRQHVDGNRNDDCGGVECQDVDPNCPSDPVTPDGQCCPVCQDGNRNDDCGGVECQDVDPNCPSDPVPPDGQCCPVCQD